jgi:hypothetical protein
MGWCIRIPVIGEGIVMNGNVESIADLLKSTVNDAQELIRSEVALAKAELREEAQRVGAAAAMLAAGIVAALLSGVFLLTAVAWGIVEMFAWPTWTGFALVGVVLTVAAVILALAGKKRLNGVRHMPRTVDTMKENLRWMRARTS